MKNTVNTQLQSPSTDIALSQASGSATLDRIDNIDITATIAGNNSANIAFTGATNDICTTATAHGFTTGVKVTLTTTDTLPAGLSTSTDYYLIVLSTTTFSVATSQANALAGTAIDITDTGTGTHTVAVTTALAGAVTIQKNNNPPGIAAVWVDVDNDEIVNSNNAITFAAAGNINYVLKEIGFRELRAVVSITSGTIIANVRLHGKG